MTLLSRNSSDKVVPQLHFKRMGREFAMQYLYEHEFLAAEPDPDEPAERERFWEQAASAHITHDERTFKKSRGYAEKIIDGVLENIEKIDGIISKFSEKWDISRIASVDRNILRVAIFEMMFCPDIPHLVSIDEAIEISKDFATDRSGTFINGILNGVKDDLAEGKDAADKK